MNEAQSKRAPSRRVHLYSGADFHCALLGSLGFSTKFIENRTALSRSQISYRLRLAHIRRTDYRNGASVIAAAALSAQRPLVLSELRNHLERSGVANPNAHPFRTWPNAEAYKGMPQKQASIG